MEASAEKALKFASDYGTIDGAHHKAWVVDQMVRALTECPMVTASALDCSGHPYDYEAQGESEAYKAFVAEQDAWDIGIAP